MSNSRLDGCAHYKPVNIPPPDPASARAALLVSGGASYVVAQEKRFSAANDIRAAASEARDLRRVANKCERRLRRLERKRGRTSTIVSVPQHKSAHKRTIFGILGTTILLISFLFGMVVANEVTTEYVLASASDLFANNPVGAHLFATLPMFGALGLKAFERTLSIAARWRFGATVLSLGFVGLSAWLVTAALTFAPQVAGSTDWLLADTSANLRTMILVLTTNICEVTFGFGVFSWSERLMFGAPKIAWVVNPKHELLSTLVASLAEETQSLRASQYATEDFLVRVEAGRQLVKDLAEQEVDRAREQWLQAQSLAQSYAIGSFLNPENPDLHWRPQ